MNMSDYFISANRVFFTMNPGCGVGRWNDRVGRKNSSGYGNSLNFIFYTWGM